MARQAWQASGDADLLSAKAGKDRIFLAAKIEERSVCQSVLHGIAHQIRPLWRFIFSIKWVLGADRLIADE